MRTADADGLSATAISNIHLSRALCSYQSSREDVGIRPTDPDRRQDALTHEYVSPYHDPTDEPVATEKFDWSFNDANLPVDTWKVMTYSEILDFHQATKAATAGIVPGTLAGPENASTTASPLSHHSGSRRGTRFFGIPPIKYGEMGVGLRWSYRLLKLSRYGLLRDSSKKDTRRDEWSGGTKLVLERQDE
ncbi:hypothetical protein B0H13DRAFT_1907463 [Mycena leptocephala]|nr:hypothetical protein B0H13DRAFT_1907463 [Mycena leptocephala]